jgi:hypothetical protein
LSSALGALGVKNKVLTAIRMQLCLMLSTHRSALFRLTVALHLKSSPQRLRARCYPSHCSLVVHRSWAPSTLHPWWRLPHRCNVEFPLWRLRLQLGLKHLQALC